MLSTPANLAHSINGRFNFMEKWIQRLQTDINFVNEQLSTINAKNIAQDTSISTINTTLSSLPETIFDIIYPIGSIYTTITTDPPLM